MKKTILLVAETSNKLDSLNHVLETEGCALIHFVNHEQAISTIEKGIPDLILISVMAPNSDGYDFCKRVKENENNADIPVVFITDSTRPDDKVLGYEAGGVDCIEMPFLAIEVLQRIKSQIDLRNSKQKVLDYAFKYNTAESLLNMGNWEWYVAEDTVNWSDGLYAIYAENRESFTPSFGGYIGKIVEEDAERIQNTIMEAFQGKKGFKCDERIMRPNGEVRHLKTWGEVVLNKAGTVIRMNGACLDITAAKIEEEDLKSIENLTSTVGGIKYFEAITNYLTTKLNFKYAFVGEYFAKTHSIGTIGFSCEGKAVDNISYSLKDTPCDNVINKKPCIYPAQCQQLFPLDEDLKTLSISGYMAVPLFRGDEPIGIIVLMSEDPIVDTKRIQRHLNALIVRTETEIERYQKERDLDEYKRYFSISTDLLCFINEDGFYERVNPTFIATLGYSEAELKSKRLIEFVHPDDVEATLVEVDNIRTTGSGFDGFVHRVQCKDGSYVSFLWSCSVDLASGKVFGAARNVTKIRKQEHALRVSQERLSLAVSAGKIGVWDWDIKNNELLWDDSMYSLYGMKRGDFAGDYEAWANCLYPEDMEFTQEAVKLALSGEKEFDVEYRVQTGGGEIINVKAKAEVEFEDGAAIRMVGVNIDVTRQVKAEEVQMMLKDSLLKEQELSELKSRFVSTASHQFRTPLAVIQSNLGLLEMQIDQVSESFRPKIERISDRIKGEVVRMTGLMNDVLIIGKINVGGVVPVFKDTDIVNLFEEVLKNMNPIQDDGRKAILKVTGDRRLLDLDAKLMEHALSNVLSNAFKYSKGKEAPIARIQFEKDYVAIEVEDFGMGIPKAEIQFLFDPFYRASNVNEIPGTGLGTSIIKEYVEVNKGTVKIESDKDTGCLVSLNF